jgi:hypothetical protein
MTPSLIRGWLLPKPRPSGVRCKVALGESRTVVCPPDANWSEIAQQIALMQPEYLEALDSEDKVIRTAVGQQFCDDDEPEESNIIPTIPAGQGTLVDSRLLEVLGRELSRAYEQSNRFNKIAFDALVALQNATTTQLQAATRLIEKKEALLDRAYAAGAGVQASDDGSAPLTLESLLSAFLGGAGGLSGLAGILGKGGSDSEPAQPTNGKGAPTA